MKHLTLLLLLNSLVACDLEIEALPEEVELVATAFLFTENSVMVNIYRGKNAGYIALEKYDEESQSAEIIELLKYIKIAPPKSDSWYTHFMDCKYVDGTNSPGLISEILMNNDEVSTSPAHAWQVDPVNYAIIEVDTSKISCNAPKP